MKYDLAVVGGGIMGAFHAYHAANAGKKVVLIEKDFHPSGSTVQNFGQVVPSGLSGKWFDYGRRTLEIYQSLQQKADFTLRKTGSTYVASDEDELQLLSEVKAIFDEKNYEALYLSAEETLQKHPYIQTGYAKGSVFFPEDMSVEPDKFIHLLIQFLQEQKGVTYLKADSTISCEESGNEVLLKLSSGKTIVAEQAVVCSGFVANLLFSDILQNNELIISKLQMMQSAPVNVQLNGNILTGLTIRRYESFEECPSFNNIKTPEHYEELKKWGIHVLFKQALDGSVIIGDSHEYAPVEAKTLLGDYSQNFIDELILKEAERIVRFPVRQITRTWAGFYAQHPDAIFEKQIGNRIFIRTGIGGKGMSSSAGYAEKSIQEIFS